MKRENNAKVNWKVKSMEEVGEKWERVELGEERERNDELMNDSMEKCEKQTILTQQDDVEAWCDDWDTHLICLLGWIRFKTLHNYTWRVSFQNKPKTHLKICNTKILQEISSSFQNVAGHVLHPYYCQQIPWKECILLSTVFFSFSATELNCFPKYI